MSKTTQSGGFLGALLGKFASPFKKVAVSLAENVLAPLASIASASAIDGAIQRKMHGREVIATSRVGVVRAGKRVALVTLNENMDDIIRIIKSLKNSDILIDRVSETVKHEIKKQESGFLGAMMLPMAASLIAPMASILGNILTGKGAIRA